MKPLRFFVGAICFQLLLGIASAQDLDPRAYPHVPVDITLLVAGFSYSHGGVVTDATVPIQDLQASVETPMLGVGRTFGMFGQTAQAFVALPYSWAQASALVMGEPTSTNRAGLSDMRVRFSMLPFGAPATTVEEFAKVTRETIMGVSITVVVPIGQYFPEKLINLGAHRWAFKPEIALSHPMGDRWLIDVYAGVWLFTTNRSFYPGTAVRAQDPLAAFQAHLSYNVMPMMWGAFDMTFYAGGRSTVNGLGKDDRAKNMRVGGTLVLPVGRSHSVKFGASTGAIVRIGANFTTLSVAWQTTLY
ncbi:MAG: Protein involved in meta-pathway of phenol degradation [Bacteroidetes bacterium]|nr:Protein involved in meta-pathway of phenol degradation [Bacteroidota bacterium]